MTHWQEIYTAYQVAQYGTVSKASEVLNVHRATVIRHVDTLERALKTKLFHRHSRGYTLTEAGEYFLSVAMTADEQFARLKVHLMDDELKGEFIITSLDFISPYVLPVIAKFREQNPKVTVRYLTGTSLFKLEHAQAHIAIRTGNQPQDDDYVVKPFFCLPSRLYASESYVKKFGFVTEQNFCQHQFVCIDTQHPKPPAYQWIREHVSDENIVFTSNEMNVLNDAVIKGLGIGAMMQTDGEKHGLVEVYPEFDYQKNDCWQIINWLVTHGDLHRSEKVQRFLAILQSEYALQNS